jgi:hypothetical protein
VNIAPSEIGILKQNSREDRNQDSFCPHKQMTNDTLGQTYPMNRSRDDEGIRTGRPCADCVLQIHQAIPDFLIFSG